MRTFVVIRQQTLHLHASQGSRISSFQGNYEGIPFFYCVLAISHYLKTFNLRVKVFDSVIGVFTALVYI
jgi:hypothetical protein